MDNFFLTTFPYSKKTNQSLIYKIIRKGLRILKIGELEKQLDPLVDMNTMEQRINYFHLLNGVIANDIEGDVVELGCFTGHCALIFQKVIHQNASDKILHLYDAFDMAFTEKGDIQDILIQNFKAAKLDVPQMHKGYFQDTLAEGLPGKISFAHIDSGSGGDKYQHKEILMYCLDQIYPKLSKGAICVLMDYHDPLVHTSGLDVNPGVKLACDEFLKDKEEEIVCLYGNQYSHAYFRKK